MTYNNPEEAYERADRINEPARYLRDDETEIAFYTESIQRQMRTINNVAILLDNWREDFPQRLHSEAGMGRLTHTSDNYVQLSADSVEQMRTDTREMLDNEFNQALGYCETVKGNVELVLDDYQRLIEALKDAKDECLKRLGE